MPWQLDASHSHVGFSVKHMMVSTVRGQFKSYQADLRIDESDLARSTLTGSIEVASIDTGDAARDEHLRSADFFDAANFPRITYQSRRIEALGEGRFQVYGDLTMRGETREVVLEAEYAGIAQDPWGNKRTGVSVTGTLSRKAFGLVWNALLETGGVAVGDTIKLHLDLEAVEQPAAVAATVS